VVIDDQIDEEDAEQRDHRADGQFYTADDDDEGLGDGEDAEQSDLVQGVGEIADQQEARIDEGDDRADDEDQDQQAQVFLVQDPLTYTSWPTASWSTLCSLNRLRSRNPEIAPSCMTAMRSLTPMTSSMSLEIIRIAPPASVRRRNMS